MFKHASPLQCHNNNYANSCVTILQLVNQAADYESYKPSEVSFLVSIRKYSVAICRKPDGNPCML